MPDVGYIWTPGYWAWDDGDGDYYWVPGTWCEPPAVGLLWTPGYWGWRDGIYLWNAGYWGPRIGYYGGINYGFGYVGVGYAGGYWSGGVFAYNRTVNNFGGVTIANTYNKTVVVNNVTNVSFNGGTGGTTARPTPQELAAANDHHTAATAIQTQHQVSASTNKDMLASVNHGSPTVAATSKAGTFSGQGVVGAKATTSLTPTGNNPGAGAAAKGATGNVNTLSKQGIVTSSPSGTPKGTTGNLNTLSKQGTGTGLTKQGTGTPTPGSAGSRLSNTGLPGGAGVHGAGPGGAGSGSPGGAGPKASSFSASGAPKTLNPGAGGPKVVRGSAGPAPKAKGPVH